MSQPLEISLRIEVAPINGTVADKVIVSGECYLATAEPFERCAFPAVTHPAGEIAKLRAGPRLTAAIKELLANMLLPAPNPKPEIRNS